MKNLYSHKIDLKKIELKNSQKDEFRKLLEDIEYRGYEVEDLNDGRKIVITKPGGKTVYGKPKKEDFLVFIFEPSNDALWQISHSQILKDLYSKAKEDSVKTIGLIKIFEQVFNGIDPNDLIEEILCMKFHSGESPEALIKAYKWIWGQEDVNYPNGKGRNMSWEGIEELKQDLES